MKIVLLLLALLLVPAQAAETSKKPAPAPINWLEPGFKPPRHYLDPPPNVKKEQRKFDKYLKSKKHKRWQAKK